MEIISKIQKDAKIFAQIGGVRSRFYTFLTIFLLSFVIISCDIDDERDICCESLQIDFRYSKGGADLFSQYIGSVKHYVFDANGQLYTVIEGNKNNLQHLSLGRVPVGAYSLVSLANLGKATLLEPNESQITKSQFLLKLQNLSSDDFMANGDLLYWGILNFEAIKNERLRYLCDMSNIHCHLFVKIHWHTIPPYVGGEYTLELDRVPVDYNLSPDRVQLRKTLRPDTTETPGVSTDKQVVHSFPDLEGTFAKHRVKQSLFGAELYGEFITLRYTNKHIPVFQLYYGDEAVSKPIDLAKAFSSWGWRPDELPEQIYYIEMEIFEDGKVVLNQWSQASVNDWIDGGTIGG